MQQDQDTLWVELETLDNAQRPHRLRGRMQLRDYFDLLAGCAPSLVRLDDCRADRRGPVADLFIRSVHILRVMALGPVPA
ncbi:hypothetical protein [Pseudomonas citronellolis]|uniref:hypothetical protein n=1 Tax=Pseudomonas citronellolis TaxID=53408 RepID=UPI00209DBAB9|nr:hypothetical protein [Pseudomonas citronellolis]MCP1607200.1 hypothetical protein [Pseudomonas citronellolis]MCP1658078.1 hypothetical protein [Pseudomonas citronellolis]MCP1724999.1 hypothetical protein [Pseudomonas citronellolis]MDN6872058.1 hypothetical protein [Pseudomonas citronellolis]UUC49310.1 hypothetical protein NOX82_26040 [Pseudomonas citronellolis]